MRFDAPVGTQVQRDGGVLWGGDWYDATGYATLYGATGSHAYHTGVDLNRPVDRDYREPVYAVADGLCVYSATVPAWGHVIVTRHTLPDKTVVWARYAHVENQTVKAGDPVRRGQQMATVGTYTSKVTTNHHLHFDISRRDLGANPGDWPGLDKVRLARDYVDPRAFIAAHRMNEIAAPGTKIRVTPAVGAALDFDPPITISVVS